MDASEGRVWGERRPKDSVTLQIILVFTLALCECKKKIYTLQQEKCKCKKFGRVSVHHLHTQHWFVGACLPRQGYCV